MHADDYADIAALDLAAVTSLLCKPTGAGWSAARALAVETEYRRFLFLVRRYPSTLPAPRPEVALYWHCHRLDAGKYAADCGAVFGYLLAPRPAVETRVLARLDAGATQPLRHGARYFASCAAPAAVPPACPAPL